jgi:prepilin-type N-terminal cleavage/methylation domain-containing protein
MKRLEKGFSAVEILLTVVIVAVIGLVAWRVWDATQTPATNTDTSNPKATEEAAPINSEADLDDASKDLENADVGEGYEKEVETQTNY